MLAADAGGEESGYMDVEGGSDDDMAGEAGYIETHGADEDDAGERGKPTLFNFCLIVFPPAGDGFD